MQSRPPVIICIPMPSMADSGSAAWREYSEPTAQSIADTTSYRRGADGVAARRRRR